MKVRQIGHNQIQVSKRNGTFLVSYETPVAAHIDGIGYLRTEKFWSNTTSRHINKWLDGYTANLIPQEDMDAHFAV
jgi:hypothetical protein